MKLLYRKRKYGRKDALADLLERRLIPLLCSSSNTRIDLFSRKPGSPPTGRHHRTVFYKLHSALYDLKNNMLRIL